MIKPTSTFKLSKTTKRGLALMRGTQEQRNSWKRAMIQAELAEEQARRSAGKRSKADRYSADVE